MPRLDSYSLNPDSYRAIFIGDVHMSNRLPHARPEADGITDRLNDQVRMWGALEDYRAREKIRDVWILGDLFDRALVDAATLTATVVSLVRIAKSGGSVHVLPGNHDTDDPTGSRFLVDAFNAMEVDGLVCHEGNETRLEARDWLNFFPMPYAPVPRNREHLEGIAAEVEEAPGSVLLMHNAVVGARHLGWTCDAGLGADEVCAGFDHVLSGHFHTAQEFGECGRYLGAPMQFNFGDEGEERGFWDVEFGRGRAGRLELKRQLVRVKAPQFWTVGWDALMGDGSPLGDARDGDHVRIAVKATAAEFEKLRRGIDLHVEDLEAQGFKASVQHEVAYHHEARLEAAGAAGIASPEELIAEYVGHVGVADATERDELLAMGLEIHEEVAR